jgi:hypothetical protein
MGEEAGVRVGCAGSRRRVPCARFPILAALPADLLSTLPGGLFATLAASLLLALAPAQAAFGRLPDGRLYEQVSPADKDGNVLLPTVVLSPEAALGAEDGDAVMYLTTGAVGGDSNQGGIQEIVSRRTPGVGWSSAPADPRQTGQVGLLGSPLAPGFYPSRDFSRVVFDSTSGGSSYAAAYSPEEPAGGSDLHLYLSADPFSVPAWLGRPAFAEPLPASGGGVPEWSVAGVAPDAATVWFGYSGTLLAADAAPGGRAEHAGLGLGEGPWGFYEWRAPASAAPAGEPALSEAGVLPNGRLSPFGAVPAAFAGYGGEGALPAEDADNQVSADGTRAFFVSPQPGKGAPGSEPPELYVRETFGGGEHRSVLLSRSALPGHAGEAAPHGVVAFPNASGPSSGGETDLYASPDGARAVFASTDRLAAAAPEDSSVKLYDLDLETGELTYLPGVAGQIAASSADGSRLLFLKAGEPAELDLWREGPEGGTVETITPISPGREAAHPEVTPARASADGSVFLFYTPSTSGALAGFNNGGFPQFYRYDVASSTLACVSCPPRGVAPTGGAQTNFNREDRSLQPVRMMSVDGSRVFFASPDPLLPTDVNGEPDVYEWENGRVYLISSGVSAAPSRFLDSSETGGDVFFATEQGLVPGDSDEAPDVYDARVPRPGDSPPPAATPCSGEECRGPPNVPRLLSAGGSATFEGLGNIPPEAKAPKPKPKPKHKAKRKHKKKHKAPAKKVGKGNGSSKSDRRER